MWTATGLFDAGAGGNVFTYCGFRPKGLIVWATGGGTGWSAGSSQFVRYISWSDGTNTREHVSLADRSSVTYGSTFDATYLWNSNAFVSFDDCGFTVNASASEKCYWMALGGDNVEVAVGHYTVPNTGSLADIAVTGAGFQPDFLVAAYDSADGIGAGWGVGMASSSATADQACTMTQFTAGPRQIQRFDETYLTWGWGLDFFNPTTVQTLHRERLKSFDADGFTVEVSVNLAGQPSLVNYIAVKDPDSSFQVATDTQKTTTGTKATTGVGFAPNTGIFAGSNRTATTGVDATVPIYTSVGAAAGTAQQFVSWHGGDTGPPTLHDYLDSGSVILAALDSGNIYGVAVVDSWDSDGFTLDWTVTDGTARRFLYGVWESTVFPYLPCDRPATSFDFELHG